MSVDPTTGVVLLKKPPAMASSAALARTLCSRAQSETATEDVALHAFEQLITELFDRDDEWKIRAASTIDRQRRHSFVFFLVEWWAPLSKLVPTDGVCNRFFGTVTDSFMSSLSIMALAASGPDVFSSCGIDGVKLNDAISNINTAILPWRSIRDEDSE